MPDYRFDLEETLRYDVTFWCTLCQTLYVMDNVTVVLEKDLSRAVLGFQKREGAPITHCCDAPAKTRVGMAVFAGFKETGR